MVTALELLDLGLHVVLVDRDEAVGFGGLAKWSFGGIFLVGTREQRRLGFADSPELALNDWMQTGELSEADSWPRRWASTFVEGVSEHVESYLRNLGVRFFPVVHWVERGDGRGGNSVPRFHMVWGTGHRLIELLADRLESHPARDRLFLRFRHRVTDIDTTNRVVSGVHGVDEASGRSFRAFADAVVVAAGGYCGNMAWLRKHWDAELGHPPDLILNGSHRFADGALHRVVAARGGQLDNTHMAWFYAAGIHHPAPRHALHGLSVVPPKSALWLNWRGERIGPSPLVSGFDTRQLVQQICHQQQQYSWQVMNWEIARRELAVSGAEYNEAIRDRKIFRFLRDVLRGNPSLVTRLADDCDDVVVADSLPQLAAAMNALTGTEDIRTETLEATVRSYDDSIDDGSAFSEDDQVRRIAALRKYRGDRVRTCKFQKILDPAARPLIALREFILSRKSLGGIRTDLQCRVLGVEDQPAVSGLYAVGESAGFGGGGIHGKRSLEGTFLATCIFTGRRAAQSIAGTSL